MSQIFVNKNKFIKKLVFLIIGLIFIYQIKYANNDYKSIIKFNFQDLDIVLSIKRINNLLQLLSLRESSFYSITNEIGVLSLNEIKKYFKNDSISNEQINFEIFKQEIETYMYLSTNETIESSSVFIKLLNELNKYEQVNATVGNKLNSMSKNSISDVVFLLAADKQFYKTLKHTLKLIFVHFPKNKIIIYDMGLQYDMIVEIKKNPNCDVKLYNKEKYGKFSAHLKNLITYGWKPIIIQETLKDMKKNEILFYMDTSIKFKSNKIEQVLEKVEKYGIVTRYLDLKLSCFTDRRMFEWFGESEKQYSQIKSLEANLIIIKKNFLTSLIMKTWVTCALDESCIAPKGSHIYGSFRNWIKGCHVCGCHRFDQDAFTIISTYFYDFLNNKQPVISLSESEMEFFDVKRRFYE